MPSTDEKLVAQVLLGPPCSSGFANWDGMIEIGRCVETIDGYIERIDGYIERIDGDDDKIDWSGAPFWSVYLLQTFGGMDCIADLRTEAEANAFATALLVMRKWMLHTQAK